MAGLVPDGLDRVAVPLLEVPEVAWLVVVDLARARGLEHHGLAAAGDDKSPFGRDGMPVQLARGARVQEHVDAGDPLADRELVDFRLFRPAARGDLRYSAV